MLREGEKIVTESVEKNKRRASGWNFGRRHKAYLQNSGRASVRFGWVAPRKGPPPL